MGLFSRFKSSVSGGVKVKVQAPSAIPLDQVIPVTVNITADSAQTVNSVKAEIKAQAREEGVSFNQGVNLQESRTMDQTVAQAESRDSFSISPGETKAVNLQLYMSGGAATNPYTQIPGTGAVGGVLQGIAKAMEHIDPINFLYSVHASVDVAGHNLHPSDHQPIQMLPPTGNLQSGTVSAVPSSQPPEQPPEPPADQNAL